MKIIKDYEKAGIAIGIGALGLAAYQAHKAKQAADATQATDPGRNPVTAAIDLSKNMIGGTASWFRKRYDDATGFTKGKASTIIDTIKAVPSGASYWVTKATDFGRDSTEAGSKYLWSLIGKTAKNSKEKVQQLTNKPFTLMGSLVQVFDISRKVPRSSQPVADSLTGVGSKTEMTEETKKQKLHNVMTGGFGNLMHHMGR